jgi:hypothetical protein
LEGARRCARSGSSCFGSLRLADADEAMRHSLPHVQSGVDACGDGALDISKRVIEKHFVIPGLYTDGRKADEIPVEGRGYRILRVMALQIGLEEALGLLPDEVGVRVCTSLPTRAGQREIRDRR